LLSHAVLNNRFQDCLHGDLTVPPVHPPTHCSSHSSHTRLLGFWYSPLHVHMCERGSEGVRGEEGSEGVRKGGKDEDVQKMHKWANILATPT